MKGSEEANPWIHEVDQCLLETGVKGNRELLIMHMGLTKMFWNYIAVKLVQVCVYTGKSLNYTFLKGDCCGI